MDGLIDAPKHKELIYDIGMHKGEDSEFYLRKGFRVVAFEADPDLLAFCKKRLKEFIDKGQLVIIEGAILDFDNILSAPSKVHFYKNNDVSVWGTVCANWAERNEKLGTTSAMVEVDAINLADVIRKHGVPHYMKIDIEGCDVLCLKTLKKFKHRPNYVSIESDKTSFKNIKSEIDLLVDLGYAGFQAIEQSAIPYSQSPPSPPTEGKYVAQRFEEGSSGLFGSELPGKCKSKNGILRQYRIIRLGYFLLGDEGIMIPWTFSGAWILRALVWRVLLFFTKATVPGWYDTHARHSLADS